MELKEGHMGGGSLVTNSMPVTYGCASLHPFLSATGGSLSLMAEQGTDPAVSRMLLGVPIHHNAPPAEFQPKVQGSGRMPLSQVTTRLAAGRCHHCSPQNKPLSTNRIVEGPHVVTGDTAEPLKTYMETNRGVTTGLDRPGAWLSPAG